jgi:hypothetical protein
LKFSLWASTAAVSLAMEAAAQTKELGPQVKPFRLSQNLKSRQIEKSLKKKVKFDQFHMSLTL